MVVTKTTREFYNDFMLGKQIKMNLDNFKVFLDYLYISNFTGDMKINFIGVCVTFKINS